MLSLIRKPCQIHLVLLVVLHVIFGIDLYKKIGAVSSSASGLKPSHTSELALLMAFRACLFIKFNASNALRDVQSLRVISKIR